MTRLIPFLAALTLTSPAISADLRLDGTQRFFTSSLPEALQLSAVRRPIVGAAGSPRVDTLAYQLSIQLSLTGRPTDALGLRLGLDSGLFEVSEDGVRVDFKDGVSAWKETLGLGETWAELQLGEAGVALLRAGKLRPRLGGGAVFDAYAFGLHADVDLRLLTNSVPIYVRAHALLPDGTFTSRSKTSPLFGLELGYEPHSGLELRLLGLLFVDREDLTAPIFADAFGRGVLEATRALLASRPRLDVLVPRCGPAGSVPLSDCMTVLYNQGLVGFELETDGLLGWAGLEAEWAWSPRARVRALALLGTGHVSVRTAPDGGFAALLRDVFPQVLPEAPLLAERLSPEGALTVLSGFGLLEAELWALDSLLLSAFALTATGDAGLQGATDTYSGFLSLAPLLPYTSLFFGGAVITNLATPVVVSASPDGAGLIGGGVGLQWWPTDRLRLAVTGAVLAAMSVSELSLARFMGVELDLAFGYWLIDRTLSVDVDTAFFLPGPFFGTETTAAYQAIISTSLRFP